MRLCSIASGSSGNCIYVGTDTTHILVDAGISGKRTKAGVESLDLDMRDLDGILITHEHSDHIGGLGVLARSYGIPIYGTKRTLQAIASYKSTGVIDESLFHEVRPDESFILKDMTIAPMHTSHDAADPVAYRFSHGKSRAAVITDLGCYDDYTVGCLTGMDVLFLEANHDINMLQVGPYPFQLKQRILGDKGHLSNERSGKLLCEVLHDGMKEIQLGHLSQENNLPELAFEAVRLEVTMSDTPYQGNDFPISVAKRNEPSHVIHF